MKGTKNRRWITSRCLEIQVRLYVKIVRKKCAVLMTICSMGSISGDMDMELADRILILIAIANVI